MRTLRLFTAATLALIFLASVGSMSTNAQGPTDPGPSQVAYLDNQPHTLAANASQLLRFDYRINADASRPTTTIRLVNGTKSGVNFEVWTADGLRNLTTMTADTQKNDPSIQPVGRGTPQNINCDTGALDGSGSCQSPDLVWTGTFGSSGPYFVRVINANNSEANYQVTIQGTGISLQPSQQTASAAPGQTPAAAPPLAATTDDPSRAAALDGQPHSLPASGATWYRFDYAIKDDASRPRATIRLVNGNNAGVNFEVWSADRLGNLAAASGDTKAMDPSIQPIGRGTAQNVNCDTGVLDGSGSCKSPDLVWTGTFGTSGTYFVRVINTNTSPSNYQLVMTTQ